MNAVAIIVGDEILAGHVQDANTHFIAGRLAALGHRLQRAVVIADEPAEIAGEVRRARGEGAAIVFVCGGLGSTHDDRTMEGVAAALDRPLEPCAPLAEQIESVIEAAAAEGFDGSFGSEAMRKMALAPRGAELLECGWRFVPAVAVDVDSIAVVILPGPPRQLAKVFTDAVEPRYLAGTGDEVHREELRHDFPESTFAATLGDVARDNPDVTIGSYPQSSHTLIRIAGPTAQVGPVADRIRAAIDELGASDRGKAFLRFLRNRRP